MTCTRAPQTGTGPVRRRVRVAVLIVVVGLAGCTSPGRTPPTATNSAPTTNSPAASASTSAPASGLPRLPQSSWEPPGTDDQGPPASPPPPESVALSTATSFARAWVRSDLPAAQWYAAVEPLCEPGFAALLRDTDPSRVAASQLTGPAIAKAQRADNVLEYRFPTDAGTLVVRLGVVGGRWLVTGNDFARAVS